MWLVDFFSAEWMLKGSRPNGGAIVVARTIWVTIWVAVAVIAARNVVDPERGWDLCLYQLQKDLLEIGPWLSAVFGGVYLAFYARFAAQWSYLASLYNQIKQTEVGGGSSNALAQWQAGFIEDADDLHLVSKPVIAGVIFHWADIPEVKAAFEHTAGGSVRLDKIQRRAKAAHEEAARKHERRA